MTPATPATGNPPARQRIGIRALFRRVEVGSQTRPISVVYGRNVQVPPASIVSPGVRSGELHALACRVIPLWQVAVALKSAPLPDAPVEPSRPCASVYACAVTVPGTVGA